MTELQAVTTRILEARASIPAQRSVLAAITGIDGCGKGYLAAQLISQRATQGVRAAIISVDGWLNLPHARFDSSNPAEHFYLHAIRFDEMFSQLVLPLRDRRSLRLEADYAEETAAEYRRHVYEFEELDVILLEGIYLLKRPFQAYYDLSVWIECSFETALERAIARSQEGLRPEATAKAYRTIYFPAQEIHFRRDDPRNAATLIVDNDTRSGRASTPSLDDKSAGEAGN
jgi:uridine kinase